jgi:hypothetical protein
VGVKYAVGVLSGRVNRTVNHESGLIYRIIALSDDIPVKVNLDEV